MHFFVKARFLESLNTVWDGSPLNSRLEKDGVDGRDPGDFVADIMGYGEKRKKEKKKKKGKRRSAWVRILCRTFHCVMCENRTPFLQ
jgi:hypothetical protein